MKWACALPPDIRWLLPLVTDGSPALSLWAHQAGLVPAHPSSWRDSRAAYRAEDEGDSEHDERGRPEEVEVDVGQELADEEEGAHDDEDAAEDDGPLATVGPPRGPASLALRAALDPRIRPRRSGGGLTGRLSGRRRCLSQGCLSRRLLGHDDGHNHVHEERQETGGQHEHSPDDAHERGIEVQPLGEAARDAGDHPLVTGSVEAIVHQSHPPRRTVAEPTLTLSVSSLRSLAVAQSSDSQASPLRLKPPWKLVEASVSLDVTRSPTPNGMQTLRLAALTEALPRVALAGSVRSVSAAFTEREKCPTRASDRSMLPSAALSEALSDEMTAPPRSALSVPASTVRARSRVVAVGSVTASRARPRSGKKFPGRFSGSTLSEAGPPRTSTAPPDQPDASTDHPPPPLVETAISPHATWRSMAATPPLKTPVWTGAPEGMPSPGPTQAMLTRGPRIASAPSAPSRWQPSGRLTSEQIWTPTGMPKASMRSGGRVPGT